MPGNIYAPSSSAGLDGCRWIYQYTNADGADPGTVCGQAACATLLTYCGMLSPNISTLRKIEKSHPPDLLFGAFGTSPGRIEAILRHYGARHLEHFSTIDALKRHVSRLCPVICLIQNTGGLGGLPDGAHWFVVFAYDDGDVAVTNYGKVHMSWSDFRERWDSAISTVASVAFKGITNTTRILPDRVPFPNNIA
ncbi:C39 family peptidase [Sorangium sp. So ce861]|uniref:C39 family peptidase n=1 Tax=Sorangium sp. So ce861 TaxID=3133323 RepID=UPI003F61BD2F